MDYEREFELAGTMGRAQIIIILITYLVMMFSGWQLLITVFAARDIDFTCSDKLPNSTTLLLNSENYNESLLVFENECSPKCSEYIYQPGISSITKDFKLDCGQKSYLKNFVHAPYWLGYLLSNLIAGHLGDKIGRKPVCIASIAFYALSSFGSIFCPNIETFLITRVITGLAQGGSFPLSYLILVECVDIAFISQISLLSQIIFGLGGIVAAIVGYFLIFSWKCQFICFGCTVGFSFITCLFLLPESPRWLYSKGKIDKSRSVLRWIAKLNRKNVAPKTCSNMHACMLKQHEADLLGDVEKPELITLMEDSLKVDYSNETKSMESCVTPHFFHLCGNFHGAMIVLGHLLAWAASSIMFCGLNFAVQDIGSNFYLNSVFLSACEIPTLILYKLVNKFGRKWIISGTIFLASISCFMLPFTKGFLQGYLELSIAIFAKFMATGAYHLLYIYTPESFPTVLRSTAMSFCFLAQNISITAAAIMTETNFAPMGSGPFMVYGSLGILAVLVVGVFGKETLGVPLFNTVTEFNDFVIS